VIDANKFYSKRDFMDDVTMSDNEAEVVNVGVPGSADVESFFGTASEEPGRVLPLWKYWKKDAGGKFATCLQCSTVIKTTCGSTTGLHVHLRSRHNITVPKRNTSGNY